MDQARGATARNRAWAENERESAGLICESERRILEGAVYNQWLLKHLDSIDCKNTQEGYVHTIKL